MKQAYEYLLSLVTIALVVTGLAGVSFHAFRDRGWIESGLGRVWSFEMDYPMVAVPLTAAAVGLFVVWRNHYLVHGRISRVPALVIYCLMGAGAFFIGHYALHGTL